MSVHPQNFDLLRVLYPKNLVFMLLKCIMISCKMVLLHTNGLTCDDCFHEEDSTLNVLCMCIEFCVINYVYEMLFYMMHQIMVYGIGMSLCLSMWDI